MKRISETSLAALLIVMAGSVLAQGTPHGYDYPEVVDPVKAAEGEARMHQSDDLKRLAKDALRKGDTPKAIKLLEQAVSIYIDPEPRILLSDLYARAGKTNDVLRILRAVIYPPSSNYCDINHFPTTRMKYVLALLDKYEWAEAVTVYEESFTGVQVSIYKQSKNGELTWNLPDYNGTVHTLPEVHFTLENPDYPGLRAQAHLILGARTPEFVEYKDKPKYMLEHLQQALKNNRRSLDALFISGHLLAVMERFDEARAMYERTAKFAPKETKPEIEAALKDLKVREDRKKAREAFETAPSVRKPTPSVMP